MTGLSYINKEKSIETGILVRKHDWLDYIDKFSFFVIAGAFIFYGVLIEINTPVDGEFTGFLVYILAPFAIILGAYCIYRKLFENKLIRVSTPFPKKENITALKDFLKKYNYSISGENEDVIIVIDEHMMSYNGIWRKKYTFLIDDYNLYFNVVKLYPVIAPPVLFSHLALKADLKKFVAAY